MDFRTYLRGQLTFAHNTLEQVVTDLQSELLHKSHAGSTTPNIAAIYAHAVLAEDGIVNGMVMGRAPLFNADLAAKTGVPLNSTPRQNDDWAKSIKMNLPEFREFAKAVYANTDKIIAELDDSTAEAIIDTPFGKQPRQEFIGNLGVTHMWGHLGEIAALKGVEGLKGLPF